MCFEEVTLSRELLGRSLPGGQGVGPQGFTGHAHVNKQSILFGRRMSFALEQYALRKAGKPSSAEGAGGVGFPRSRAANCVSEGHSPSNPTSG